MNIYLYQNQNKKEAKHPDYRAVIQENGTFKPVGCAYINQSKTGEEYIKIMIEQGGNEDEKKEEHA